MTSNLRFLIKCFFIPFLIKTFVSIYLFSVSNNHVVGLAQFVNVNVFYEIETHFNCVIIMYIYFSTPVCMCVCFPLPVYVCMYVCLNISYPGMYVCLPKYFSTPACLYV